MIADTIAKKIEAIDVVKNSKLNFINIDANQPFSEVILEVKRKIWNIL